MRRCLLGTQLSRLPSRWEDLQLSFLFASVALSGRPNIYHHRETFPALLLAAWDLRELNVKSKAALCWGGEHTKWNDTKVQDSGLSLHETWGLLNPSFTVYTVMEMFIQSAHLSFFIFNTFFMYWLSFTSNLPLSILKVWLYNTHISTPGDCLLEDSADKCDSLLCCFLSFLLSGWNFRTSSTRARASSLCPSPLRASWRAGLTNDGALRQTEESPAFALFLCGDVCEHEPWCTSVSSSSGCFQKFCMSWSVEHFPWAGSPLLLLGFLYVLPLVMWDFSLHFLEPMKNMASSVAVWLSLCQLIHRNVPKRKPSSSQSTSWVFDETRPLIWTTSVEVDRLWVLFPEKEQWLTTILAFPLELEKCAFVFMTRACLCYCHRLSV